MVISARLFDNSLVALSGSGLFIDDAARCVAQALKLVGSVDNILAACRTWKENITSEIVPTLLAKAVEEFITRQKIWLGERRHKTMSSYLKALKEKFGECPVSEIKSSHITDLMAERNWAKKTWNDALSSFSLFFRDAIDRNLCRRNSADKDFIQRKRLPASDIEIFTPEETKLILKHCGDEMRPFLALWFFSDARISEIARLTWEQVNAGLQTGYIHLKSSETKTGFARSVPVLPNLKVWLALDKVPTDVKRSRSLCPPRAGITWRANGPRHSYITYRSKILGSTVDGKFWLDQQEGLRQYFELLARSRFG